MALNFNQMRDDMAQAIADALAAASTSSFATLQASSLGIPATWNGTATVVCPDTSQVQPNNFVKANKGSVADNWFQVVSVTPNVSFVVSDFYSIGAFPSGGGPSNLPQSLIWDGTPVIIATDTSGIVAGDSIRLNSDGQFFFVLNVVTNVSIQIAPGDLTIPSGAGTSSIANSSRTLQALPAPPDSSALVETAGEPIAFPVVDEGVEVLSTSPHELPPFTVAGLAGISAPALGSMVFVTNASGGSIPAFFDGTNWRRVDTRAIVT